jgi:hypothetical protein
MLQKIGEGGSNSTMPRRGVAGCSSLTQRLDWIVHMRVERKFQRFYLWTIALLTALYAGVVGPQGWAASPAGIEPNSSGSLWERNRPDTFASTASTSLSPEKRDEIRAAVATPRCLGHGPGRDGSACAARHSQQRSIHPHSSRVRAGYPGSERSAHKLHSTGFASTERARRDRGRNAPKHHLYCRSRSQAVSSAVSGNLFWCPRLRVHKA